jgi:hypothetical protein
VEVKYVLVQLLERLIAWLSAVNLSGFFDAVIQLFQEILNILTGVITL